MKIEIFEVFSLLELEYCLKRKAEDPKGVPWSVLFWEEYRISLSVRQNRERLGLTALPRGPFLTHVIALSKEVADYLISKFGWELGHSFSDKMSCLHAKLSGTEVWAKLRDCEGPAKSAA